MYVSKHILIRRYGLVLYQFAAASLMHSPTVTTKNKFPSVKANGRKQEYEEGSTYTGILVELLYRS